MQTLQPLSDTLLTRRFLKRMEAVRTAIVLLAAAAIAVASEALALHIPRLPVSLVLGYLLFAGWVRYHRLSASKSPEAPQVFLGMVFDVLALTILFYFLGGASNPFIWFFLFPTILAAVILPQNLARALSILSVICYSSLLFFYEPLHPRGTPDPSPGFKMHVIGMWLGFLISAGFVAVVISGLAERLRKRERVLSEAREQALRNDHMIALGTLAAGAAHELGTPLATMAILSTELQDDPTVKDRPELGEKLHLMREQVERCKQTLSLFSSQAGAARAESGRAMDVNDFLMRLTSDWQKQNPSVPLQVHITGRIKGTWIFVERTLFQALHNLMDNAADVSPQGVTLRSGWNHDTLTVKIIDQGPGISQEVIDNLGRKGISDKKGGMGMGLYLANSTIHRMGGHLELSNLTSGAMARVTLPLFSSEKRA